MFAYFVGRFFNNTSSRQTKQLRQIRSRISRLEFLENRELLSVTTAEFVALRSQYADLELSANMADYNVIEITAAQLSETSLRNAITTAGTTTKSDLIVLRATASQNTITLSGTQLEISINATNYGSVAIVSLADSTGKSLTISGNNKSKIFSISISSEAKLGGMTLVQGKAPTNAGGAAISSSGLLTITQSIIKTNSASAGAAIACGGQTKITYSAITENSATDGSGGAIWNDGGTLTIQNSYITKNTATSMGGGIYNISGSVIIANSIVAGNIVSKANMVNSGGGIYNNANMTITNTVIAGNATRSSSSGQGGGIFNNGILTVTNSTIAGNMAGKGGGVYSWKSTYLRNTIVAGNVVNDSTKGVDTWVDTTVAIPTSPFITAAYTFIGSYYSSDTEDGQFNNNGGNILGLRRAVPPFTNFATYTTWNKNLWESWDLHLLIGSSGVNGGSNSYVSAGSTDLDGKPRIINGTVDMGAYEYGTFTPGIPQVTITQSGANVQLSWSAIAGADRYGVYRRTASGSWAALNTNVTGTTFTDLSVPLGTQIYAVRAFRGTAFSDFKEVSITVLGIPQVTATQANGNVTLIWAAITDADRYCVYRLVNGKWTSLGYVTTTTFTENNVPKGLQTYAVRAFKGTTMSDYQQGVTITILGVPQVNISQSNGNVTLNWAAIAGADHYGVYRLVNGQWTVANTNVTTTTFTENNVSTGSQTYAVRAFKGTVYSGYQQGVTITVVPATLGIPQVTLSQANGNVTLKWAAIPTATHYSVYRLVNGKWTVVNANVTATTFTENNVPTGTQTYAVRAFKGTTISDYQQGATINVVPVTLGVPQVTPTQANGKVTLTWAAITDADRYCVYRLVNGKWTSLGYVTATTFTENNVPAGLQTYAVRAFKGTVMSEYQQGVAITI